MKWRKIRWSFWQKGIIFMEEECPYSRLKWENEIPSIANARLKLKNLSKDEWEIPWDERIFGLNIISSNLDK